MNPLEDMVQQFGPPPAAAPSAEYDTPLNIDPSISSLIASIDTAMTSSVPMEIYKFYGGRIEIPFDPVKHIYYLRNPEVGNLIRVPNSSSVCHIIDRSLALVPWGAKKVVEKLLASVPTYLSGAGVLMIKEMTFEEFSKLAMIAKDAHKEELEEAGDIGTMVHKWLERYIKAVLAKNADTQKALLTFMCQDDRATKCCHAALAWMSNHNVRWLEAEQKVYSEKYNYAGTFDGIALVDCCKDQLCCSHRFFNRKSIVDWKSSNHLHIEYLFQGASYRQAKNEEMGAGINDVWVLRLGKEDGKFEPWHIQDAECNEDFDGFIACLELYNLVETVEDRMSIRKRTVREAKREAKAVAKELAEATEKVQKAVARAIKKLVKEESTAVAKAAKDAAKAEAKAAKERMKDALLPKKSKVAVCTNKLLGRVAELSPAVAQLLKDAHAESEAVSVSPVLKLSEADSKIVVEALLNPPAPNEALRAAAELHPVEEDTPAPFKIAMEE
jgi:Protein of unknown function (DUF1778)